MNKDIMKAVGFAAEVEAVEDGKCSICKQGIKMTQFTDSISLAEYNISGMCQRCQDEIFTGEEEISYSYRAKLIMLQEGKYYFPPPPVCTAKWDHLSWIKWIDDRGEWRR